MKIFRRMREGHYDEAELEDQLNNRGFMNRFYKRATNAIKKPWQMYPVGLLFGLGFDTATEIALLAHRRRRRRRRAADLRDPLPADPVRRRDVAARHDRRRVHELRLRLGVLEAGPKDLLQHHDHLALGGVALVIGTIELLVGARRQAQPRRPAVGLRLQPRPELRRLRDRRGCSSSPGWSRWRSGTSVASRSGGRRDAPGGST